MDAGSKKQQDAAIQNQFLKWAELQPEPAAESNSLPPALASNVNSNNQQIKALSTKKPKPPTAPTGSAIYGGYTMGQTPGPLKHASDQSAVEFGTKLAQDPLGGPAVDSGPLPPDSPVRPPGGVGPLPPDSPARPPLPAPKPAPAPATGGPYSGGGVGHISGTAGSPSEQVAPAPQQSSKQWAAPGPGTGGPPQTNTTAANQTWSDWAYNLGATPEEQKATAKRKYYEGINQKLIDENDSRRIDVSTGKYITPSGSATPAPAAQNSGGGSVTPFGIVGDVLNKSSAAIKFGNEVSSMATVAPKPPPQDNQQLVSREAKGQPLANQQSLLKANPKPSTLFKPPSTANKMYQDYGSKMAELTVQPSIQNQPGSSTMDLDKARRTFQQDAYQRQIRQDASTEVKAAQERLFDPPSGGSGFFSPKAPATSMTPPKPFPTPTAGATPPSQPQPQPQPTPAVGSPVQPAPVTGAPAQTSPTQTSPTQTSPTQTATAQTSPTQTSPAPVPEQSFGDKMKGYAQEYLPESVTGALGIGADPDAVLGSPPEEVVDEAKKDPKGFMDGVLNWAPDMLGLPTEKMSPILKGLMSIGGPMVIIMLLMKLFGGKSASWTDAQVKQAAFFWNDMSPGERAKLRGEAMAKQAGCGTSHAYKSAPRHSATSKTKRKKGKFGKNTNFQGSKVKKADAEDNLLHRMTSKGKLDKGSAIAIAKSKGWIKQEGKHLGLTSKGKGPAANADKSVAEKKADDSNVTVNAPGIFDSAIDLARKDPVGRIGAMAAGGAGLGALGGNTRRGLSTGLGAGIGEMISRQLTPRNSDISPSLMQLLGTLGGGAGGYMLDRYLTGDKEKEKQANEGMIQQYIAQGMTPEQAMKKSYPGWSQDQLNSQLDTYESKHMGGTNVVNMPKATVTGDYGGSSPAMGTPSNEITGSLVGSSQHKAAAFGTKLANTLMISKTTVTKKPAKKVGKFDVIPSIAPGDHKTPSTNDMARSKDISGAKAVDIS